MKGGRWAALLFLPRKTACLVLGFDAGGLDDLGPEFVERSLMLFVDFDDLRALAAFLLPDGRGGCEVDASVDGVEFFDGEVDGWHGLNPFM